MRPKAPKGKFVCICVQFKKSLKPAVCWDAVDAEEKRRFRTFARNLSAALAAHRMRVSFRTAIERYTPVEVDEGWYWLDVNGNESPDGDGPIREDWIYGAPTTNAWPGATLQVAGTLAIGSNQAPPLQLATAQTASAVIVLVGTAPTGAGLTININVGGVLSMTLTIPAGDLSVQATSAQLSAAAQIAGASRITLDITAVGTTVPGADLSVFIYL
jgi:hypothetical protein